MFKMSERPAAELNIKHLQVNSAAVLNQNICVTFFFRFFFFLNLVVLTLDCFYIYI